MRVYEANTIRRQKGKADAEFGYNTNLLTEKYPTDYQFKTKNVAVFVENLFRMNKNFSITQGIRFEHINSFAEGRANIVAGNDVNIAPQNVVRNIVLAGIGLEYKFQNTNIYANLSQAYRPVLFGDIVPPTTTDVIDANLKDASGFNADLGYRGSFTDYFNFDVSLFYLNYDNRIGTIRKFLNDDITKNTYQFRTNLGQSVNMGLEAYLELSLLKPFMKNNLQNNKIGDLSIFTSLAFINAEYKDFKTTTITGTAPNISIKEDNLKGKRVENAPKQIHNFGLTYTLKNFSATAQTRITSDVFADASNTETPTNDGIAGKVAGYSVYDFSFGYRFLEKYNLKGGINNLTDTKYATRRTGGNGGGLISGEGRTFYISVGAKF